MRALRVIGITFAVFSMIVVFTVTTFSFLAWILARRTPVDLWLWLAGPR